MSAPKHTAGPWEVATEYPGELTIKTADGDWCIAGCLPGGKPTEKANARLIAAAPDLLEALTTPVIHLVEGEEGFVFLTIDGVQIARLPSDSIAAAALLKWDASQRAALAKATGESAS